MPEITSADAATEVAVQFAKRYKSYVTPLSARKDDGVWQVELDVGALRVTKGWVRIDAASGSILDYNFSESAPLAG